VGYIDDNLDFHPGCWQRTGGCLGSALVFILAFMPWKDATQSSWGHFFQWRAAGYSLLGMFLAWAVDFGYGMSLGIGRSSKTTCVTVISVALTMVYLYLMLRAVL